MAALDKIFELLDEEPDLGDKPGAIELPRVRGEIEFDEVSFSYDGEAPALCEVDLRDPARADGRAGRAPPAPASRRWRSWSRASTTPTTGACSSTATTCAT